MADEHKGHRQRMRDRAMAEGLLGFQPHEVLELMLYPYIPYKDTNELAHRLINEFGSFAGVLEAGYDSLIKISGITKNAAFYLSMMPAMFRKYHVSKLASKPKLKNTGDMIKYLQPFMSTLKKEEVYIVSLDADYGCLGCKAIDKGISNEAFFYVRDIVEEIIRKGASYVVLAHNHPSGNVLPSQADIEMTIRLKSALDGIGIPLVDHVIIGMDKYYSFRSSGELDRLENKRMYNTGLKIGERDE